MLEPKQRKDTRIWYASGRVEYNGRPISKYYRESTGSTTERGARDWIEEETNRIIRCFLVGEERALTFADAVNLYTPNKQTAKYLIPIMDHIENETVANITPKSVRELGRSMYPDAGTDYWQRAVITPIRSVINNAHDLGRCAPIKIKGFSKAERLAQDKHRGKRSRVEKKPSDWDWILRFREHAPPQHAALALFMYVTGARISQAIEMHPKDHLDLQKNLACIPGAKGHGDRWIQIPVELVVELANLTPRVPRGWKRQKNNLRVFGFADRSGPRKGWNKACDKAKIERKGFHAAGRHGFAQEQVIRQGIDKKAVAEYGGWSGTKMLDQIYTHAEDENAKVLGGFSTGLAQAEAATGLQLAEKRGVA